MRNVRQNIADLRAQVAANEKGVQELGRMVEHFGLDVVRAYMRHVQDNAEESVRRVLGVLKDGSFRLPLDNGAVIKVKIDDRKRPEDRKDRLHRDLARSCRTTSTRPRRSAWRRCSTCSARWSTTTSRSTPAA